MGAKRTVLAIADCSEGALTSSAREILSLSRLLAEALEGDVWFLPLGTSASAMAGEAGAAGADIVCGSEATARSGYHPEVFSAASLAAADASDPALVIMAHGSMGQDLAPRLSFALGARWAGGCIGVASNGEKFSCTRTEVGGKVIVTEDVPAGSVVTLRPKSVDLRAPEPARTAKIEEITTGIALDTPSILFVERRAESGGVAAELEKAEIIVSGGLGIGGEEAFVKLRKLSQALGGSVGASKQAVDRGWISPEYQVGLTGTTVAPKLYLAVGVSGAPQHMAGCQKSKTIVAINRDPEAPIFGYARYGIVGDWEEAVDELARQL